MKFIINSPKANTFTSKHVHKLNMKFYLLPGCSSHPAGVLVAAAAVLHSFVEVEAAGRVNDDGPESQLDRRPDGGKRWA